MTAEAVSGPELDILIETNIFGMSTQHCGCGRIPEDHLEREHHARARFYSDFGAMGMLLGRMRELGWWVSIVETAPNIEQRTWFVTVYVGDGRVNAEYDTLPEAVARAALAAVDSS